jgi:putative membrane protein
MSIGDLPALNATLNASATVCLIAGLIFIKRGQKKAHIACMVTALLISVAFLVSYSIYHSAHLTTKFTHPGWPKVVYLGILITHIPLAALTVPMVLLTVIPALRQRFDRHKRIARWTYPVWLYVSVTGVLVYMMLYRWFPPEAVGL